MNFRMRKAANKSSQTAAPSTWLEYLQSLSFLKSSNVRKQVINYILHCDAFWYFVQRAFLPFFFDQLMFKGFQLPLIPPCASDRSFSCHGRSAQMLWNEPSAKAFHPPPISGELILGHKQALWPRLQESDAVSKQKQHSGWKSVRLSVMLLRFSFLSDLLRTPDKSISMTRYLAKDSNRILRNIFSAWLSLSPWRELSHASL